VSSPEDPSALAADDATVTAFAIERATMADGRTILYYTWPDEPDVAVTTEHRAATERPGSPGGPGLPADQATREAADAAEPWSVETQPDV
jgi:hypothetical protein